MRAPRPHIALLTTTLDVSGAERVMALLAEGLTSSGYRVSVVALQRRTGALAGLIRNPDVQVLDFGMSGPLDLRVIRRLRQWLTSERVSVLYSFLYHAHILGRFAGHFSRVPHVISSQQVANWGGLTRRTLDRWTSRWCERIVAVSEGVREDVIERMGFPSERVRVVFNAIDVRMYEARREPFSHGPGDERIFVGSASRLAHEKNHESLLRGFALARTSIPQLRLRLAGSGPLAGRLAEVIREEGLSEFVELLGHVDDVRTFHDQIDIYVQPSRTEGLPCAVIEAMAMRRPVIATDVPGNRDAVVHGETGWLIAPDSDEAWADGLREATTDRVRARTFGESGRVRAEHLFDAPAMVANTVQLLRELGVFTPTRA
jgi:glycosyltransferase involved in cell wall biosynthesis